MELQTSSNHTLKKIGKIALIFILSLLALVVIAVLLFLTPPVQKFAAQKAAAYLEKKIGTKVAIGGVSIGLPRHISLNNVYLEDQTKDTLVYGGSIKADLALFKLISGEINVKTIELENITAKIKRTLPDTAFNFQYIVDAFAPAQPTPVDTTSAPMKLAVDNLYLKNVRTIYKDVLTGNDMEVNIGAFDAAIDSLNLEHPLYKFGDIHLKNTVAVIKQSKPLVVSEPPSVDAADAAQPIEMDLGFGKIRLENVKLDYANDVSALYTNLDIQNLEVESNELDLRNRVVDLKNIALKNTASAIRLGKKETAKVVVKEVKQEVAAQAENDWTIRVGRLEIEDNYFAFDDENAPKQSYGLDYGHLKADSLTFVAEDFILKKDSITVAVKDGSLKEQNGFVLNELRGNIFYGSTQAYIKDLFFKTPYSEIKRDIALEYESQEALAKDFSKAFVDINIEDSRLRVSDLLQFAPQLRSQPAFRNLSDVWYLDVAAKGNMQRLRVDNLQFRGLSNTQVNVSGVLTDVMNPNGIGGNLVIRKLHTTQNDITLFTGARLSNAQMNLPESFAITGTVNGNMGQMVTNLNLSTDAGFVYLNGRFADLASPDKVRYAATLRTSGLQLGRILRNPSLGVLNASITADGIGFMPERMNTNLKGNIASVGFNKYTYRNILLDGNVKRGDFNMAADVNDANIDLDATVRGNFLKNPYYELSAMIDSVKAMPLNFTTTPLTFRGKIDGTISNPDPDNLIANVLLSKALLVTEDQRLELDSLSVLSDKNENGKFIDLKSSIANARIEGNYLLTELGYVFQKAIDPYYNLTTAPLPQTQPYDFTFRISVENSPFINSFVPGLNIAEPVTLNGSMSDVSGLKAEMNGKQFSFSGNELQGLNAQINTTPQGLQLNAHIDRIMAANNTVYNTRLNAVALNNNIDFGLGIDDKLGKNKYYLTGLFQQPSTGNYVLHLKPDSLVLNYTKWQTSPDNQLTITPEYINARNFSLQNDLQQLLLQSNGAGNQPLNISFKDFRLSTITGFVQSDSLLVDGTLNGNVIFDDLIKQPLFTSDLTINNLSLKQDTLGDVNMKVSNTSMDRYVADIKLTGFGNDIQITGPVVLQDKDVVLDLAVAVRTLQLSTMEGALATFVTRATGTIDGDIAVKGTTTQPKVNGALNFNNASISTRLVGGPLTIDGEKISVTENGFQFDQFSIKDSLNNALTIDGSVATTNFINYKFGLDVKADNFRAINTTSKDNKLYYGDLYLTTNLHVGGTEAAPIVDGTLAINDATKFSIVLPQAEPGVVQREGIVEFVNFEAPENDSLFLRNDSLNTAGITGFDITTNISISKEAVFNIIVDQANGDFLNVSGAGQLSAGIDPSGKISLTGDYEIERGAYQLSFNFLKRRFEIQKGSKITWLGDPTDAQVAVTAIYIANTAPLDLVQDQLTDATANRNIYLQKLPFQVLLKIGGLLMKPEITFDVVLPTDRNYGVGSDVVSVVNSKLVQLRQEPSELNKQVFAILLLNRFVGQNPFESSGGGFNAGSFARQSVSKLLTEQLNSLAAGLIEGVDLNFDVASSDDYTTGERRNRTDLNVGLSKRLLNNRLTVTVGSNFELEGPQQSKQNGSNIAGNVSVNYQLSKDGRYMLRFYRKNDYQGVVDGYIVETGMGFIMTVDYNKFREIIQAKKVRKEREERRKQREQNRAIQQIQEP